MPHHVSKRLELYGSDGRRHEDGRWHARAARHSAHRERDGARVIARRSCDDAGGALCWCRTLDECRNSVDGTAGLEAARDLYTRSRRWRQSALGAQERRGRQARQGQWSGSENLHGNWNERHTPARSQASNTRLRHLARADGSAREALHAHRACTLAHRPLPQQLRELLRARPASPSGSRAQIEQTARITTESEQVLDLSENLDLCSYFHCHFHIRLRRRSGVTIPRGATSS